MKRRWLQFGGVVWNANIIGLAIATFMNRFGQGLLGGARTNFFIDTLGLDGGQFLLLEGLREIPGLALIVLAALTMRLPLSRRAAASVALMGAGYALYATVHSFTALVAIAIVASLGMHMWMPLSTSLVMCLSTKETSGRLLGTLSSVGALASIVGMAVLSLISRVAPDVSLRLYFVVGGILIVGAAFLLARLPRDLGETRAEPPRMLIKARYWLYYVLTFFQGSRKQVLNTFALLVLVENFGFEVWQISLLLFLSSAINLVAAPFLGYLVDHFGERKTLSSSYLLLVLCCAGYATIRQAWLLACLLILIRLMSILGMGLSTFVNRIAPAEELTPTLSAGVSINHITSVAMPIIAGALLPIIGYEGIFFGTGALILLSVPFALQMHTDAPRATPEMAA